MKSKRDDHRYQELLEEEKELEKNGPREIDEMRRWKRSMGKISEELQPYSK